MRKDRDRANGAGRAAADLERQADEVELQRTRGRKLDEIEVFYYIDPALHEQDDVARQGHAETLIDVPRQVPGHVVGSDGGHLLCGEPFGGFARAARAGPGAVRRRRPAGRGRPRRMPRATMGGTVSMPSCVNPAGVCTAGVTATSPWRRMSMA